MTRVIYPPAALAVMLCAALSACTRTETATTASQPKIAEAPAPPAQKEPGAAAPALQTRFGPVELVNDYPTAASTRALYDELDFQRAAQAYIWAIPLVAMESLRQSNVRDFNVPDGAVAVNDAYTSPELQALTANNTTIYAGSAIDLRNGPIVIDSPPGAYGVIDDFWQRPASEVGPFGPDKGNGGKFLLIPPGAEVAVPAGYFPVHAQTNRVFYLARASVKDGNVDAAVDTLTKIGIYPLSQAASPPATQIVKTGGKPANQIAPQGIAYWKMLSDAINSETIEPRDRFFHAMLKPLGIEKGKPFQPDERQTKILTEAAALGFRMGQALSMEPRLDNAKGYPGTQWDWVLTLNPNQEADGYSQLDERTDYTFEAITVADGMIKQIPGAGSQYMSAAKDKTGAWQDGGKSYRLRIPPNAPVKDFWAVTAYDNMSRSMVQTDTHRAGVDSKQADLQRNEDGSVDVFFGPTAPAGKESNWIKTTPGKGWFAYFRWYGPTQEFFDRSWRLSDIEPTG